MVLALLAGMGLTPQAGGGTPIESPDSKFTLPQDYLPAEGSRGDSRVFGRMILEPYAGELKLRIHRVESPLDPEAPWTAADIVRFIGLPPKTQIQLTREAWREFQVPAAEYRFESAGHPNFGMCVFLPIEAKTFVLETTARQALESEARADLRKVVASATGKSYWAKPRAPMTPALKLLVNLFLGHGLVLLLAGGLWSANNVYKGGERGAGCLMMLAWIVLFLGGLNFFLSGNPAVNYLILVAPLVPLVYSLIHFDELKKPCMAQIVGYLLCFVALGLVKYRS